MFLRNKFFFFTDLLKSQIQAIIVVVWDEARERGGGGEKNKVLSLYLVDA